METEMTKPTSDSATDQKSGVAHRRFLLTQIVLRTLVVAFSIAAIVITVTDRQSVSIFGLVLDARYNYSSAMRFQVGANVVVCTFCFFVWVFLLRMFTIRSSKFNSINSFHLLLHDLVMTTLCISGCAAGATVGYLAKYGEKQSGWTPFCDYVNKFCNMGAFALAFSFLAFIILFLLTIIAAYKLNSHTTHRIAGDT